MPNISINRKLHDKLIDLLSTITITNGYNNTVQKVTKRFIDLRKCASFPIIMVERGTWSRTWDDESRQLYKTTATFGILGYVKTDSDTDDIGLLTEAKDAFEQDIEDCLLNSVNSLIAVDDGVQTVLTANGDPLLDDEERMGTIFFTLVIEYIHEANV